MALRAIEHRTQTPQVAPSFADWRARVVASGARPIILVAGSRGKTTVVRVLDSIFRAAGLRTATWTDLGVEIDAVRQRGELVPWSRVAMLLDQGKLDVAIQEVDWLTIPTQGLREEAFSLVIVTNVCANREACLIHGEAKLATQLLPTVLASATRDGVVVLNGEDFAVAGEEVPRERPEILTALSKDVPLLRVRLQSGEIGAWLDEGQLVFGSQDAQEVICQASELNFALHGAAGFHVHNALSAAAAAILCGLPVELVGKALRSYRPAPLRSPGSFNCIEIGEILAVVGRPEPSWFLRPVLRAMRDRKRLITVAGTLDGVPEVDLPEVGRLLGRSSAAVVIHSEEERPERSEALRNGIALNEVPPPIVHTTTERRAVTRALSLARPRDGILVLADHPIPVLRALLRHAEIAAKRELTAD